MKIKILGLFLTVTVMAAAQENPQKQSIGLTATFAPDSSHILIGEARQRRTWTAGVVYDRTLGEIKEIRLEYEGSISPFFLERDPTLTGAYILYANGLRFSVPTSTGKPVRVLNPSPNPIGVAPDAGGGEAPVYGIYGSEETYAVSANPIGVRASGWTSHRLQPSFSVDLGFVWATRDLPLDNTKKFNYLFSFGPGLNYQFGDTNFVRAEYVYRHMSNADSGTQNPGVDQGVIRMTVAHRF